MKLAHFEQIRYFEIMIILNLINDVYEIFSYLIRFIWLIFYPKAVLAARLLVVQSQLALCKNRIDLKKDCSICDHIQSFHELGGPAASGGDAVRNAAEVPVSG
jgi:hypothetical protein